MCGVASFSVEGRPRTTESNRAKGNRVKVHEGFCSPVTGCFRPAGVVDPEKDAAARRVLSEASAALGIDPPPLTWWVQTAFHARQWPEGWGVVGIEGMCMVDAGVICISVSVPIARIPEVVAHEAAHAVGAYEVAAADYAARWVAGERPSDYLTGWAR